jgi:hypothetical protein
VKSYSEDDVWTSVRDAESRHGDAAEAAIAQRIDNLTIAGEFDQISFWSAVAERIKDLHCIRLPERTVLPDLLARDFRVEHFQSDHTAPGYR